MKGVNSINFINRLFVKRKDVITEKSLDGADDVFINKNCKIVKLKVHNHNSYLSKFRDDYITEYPMTNENLKVAEKKFGRLYPNHHTDTFKYDYVEEVVQKKVNKLIGISKKELNNSSLTNKMKNFHENRIREMIEKAKK